MFFHIFPTFFKIFYIFTLLNLIYDPFFATKTPISENNFLMKTLLLKILGADAWAKPHILGGPSPPVPPRSLPMITPYLRPTDVLTSSA